MKDRKSERTVRFTDLGLRKLKPHRSKQVLYYDKVQKGLSILVSPGGTKTFRSTYMLNGKWCTRSIGRLGENTTERSRSDDGWSVKVAREQAELDRGLAKEGKDPKAHHAEEARRRVADGFTYREAVALFVDKHCKPRQRSWTQTEGHLLRHLEGWYERPVAAITADDLREVRDRLNEAGKERAASLAIAWIKSLWGFLEEEGKQVDPRVFDKVRNRGSDTDKREQRVYSDDEVKAIWEASAKLSVEECAYVRLTMLLAPRKTALAFAKWGDLDLAAEIWTTPAELVKQRKTIKRPRTYRTPLPAMAMSEIKKLPRGLPHVRVFRGMDGLTYNRKSDRPLFDTASLLRHLKAAHAPDDIRLHGFRHTIATWLEDQGHDEWERGLILNHKGSGVTAGYGRGYAMDRKRTLLEKWADHVAAVVSQQKEVATG
jgi:integrase